MMENELSEQVIEAAMEVHRLLGGPGLLENVYEAALCHELSLRGLRSQRQIPIPVIYKDTAIRDPLYLDILVEKMLIVEIKAVEKEYPFYQAQLLTYLRLTGIKKGLLINFGKTHLKDGISHIKN
jgi:GxxExxY protein